MQVKVAQWAGNSGNKQIDARSARHATNAQPCQPYVTPQRREPINGPELSAELFGSDANDCAKNLDNHFTSHTPSYHKYDQPAIVMSVCADCQKPLTLEVDFSDDEDHVQPAASSSSAAPPSNTVPDDVALSCGCHFHWYVAIRTNRPLRYQV